MSDQDKEDKKVDDQELEDDQLADVSGGAKRRGVGTADIQEISIDKLTDKSSPTLAS
jgi:type VI protein secretion system component Hcp